MPRGKPKKLSPAALQSTPAGRSTATTAPNVRSPENLWAYMAKLEARIEAQGARITVLEAAALKPRTFMQRVMGER